MRDERGFTLVEFLIATAITVAVLGSSVMLASQLQQSYATQLDDTVAEEEVRFALDWIGQALRNAGSNPYNVGGFNAITMGASSIRINADINPPDGDITDPNEDITIALGAGADANTITLTDNSDATPTAIPMTEPVIAGLAFTYLDSNRAVTGNPNAVAYVRVTITGQSEAYSRFLGQQTQRQLMTEVRVRVR